MAHTPDLPHFFEENINLEGLFDILSPKNNLVLADDMMLSDADGIILRVSENYERNFGFTHDSIVGKSAFDLEANGTFRPCITAEVIRQKKKITATQTINHTHKNVMTVGIPLFDQNGVLKYAVCFNTVSMEQINTIQQNYRHLQDSLQQYTQEIAELRLRATATDLVVKSPAMQRLWTLILNTANTKANILITGETGVGKSAVAKAIHAISNRANGPFIEVNCAVLHENLIESELFGYEKGAFTGAQKGGKLGKFQLADHGTLFLDEIGDMPLHLQVKLLTCLQNHQVDPVGGEAPIDVDVRIIAATNKNLEEMIEKKQFREDLYFRLNVIPIYLPPLRQRPEDIELLLTHAIRKFSQKLDKPVSAIEPEALSALLSYHWPGNVREVENVIEYAINMENSSSIGLSSLPDKILSRTSAAASARGGLLKDQLACAEREIIAECLSRTGHSLEGKRKAAEILGISESTLYRRLRALDLL